MAENIRLLVDRQQDRTLVAPGLVVGTGLPPDEFTGTADAVIVKRSFQDETLFKFWMLVEWEFCPRLPFEQASKLAHFRPLVEDLDLDAFELRWLPIHICRLDVD